MMKFMRPTSKRWIFALVVAVLCPQATAAEQILAECEKSLSLGPGDAILATVSERGEVRTAAVYSMEKTAPPVAALRVRLEVKTSDGEAHFGWRIWVAAPTRYFVEGMSAFAISGTIGPSEGTVARQEASEDTAQVATIRYWIRTNAAPEKPYELKRTRIAASDAPAKIGSSEVKKFRIQLIEDKR